MEKQLTTTLKVKILAKTWNVFQEIARCFADINDLNFTSTKTTIALEQGVVERTTTSLRISNLPVVYILRILSKYQKMIVDKTYNPDADNERGEDYINLMRTLGNLEIMSQHE
jgi:hypothetical protein